MNLRPAERCDFARMAELRNLSLSEPIDETELVNRENGLPEGTLRQRLVAEVDGVVIASAGVVRYPTMMEGFWYESIDVEPEFRSRGIGTRMIEEGQAFVRLHGGSKVLHPARDDRPRGLHFLERQGYVLHQHLVNGVLDLHSLQMPAPKACAATVVSWSNLGDDSAEARSRLHRLYVDSDADSPGAEVWGETPYSMFESQLFGIDHDPRTTWVAILEREWVGVSAIWRTPNGDFGTDYTGVLRNYRGRGIAQELKRAGVEFAQAAGAKYLRTQNDVTNAAMLRINQKFGFQPEFGWRHMKKELG